MLSIIKMYLPAQEDEDIWLESHQQTPVLSCVLRTHT